MSNQNDSISKKAPQYDAGDMHDLASLAESDLNWSAFAIQDTRARVIALKKQITEKYADAQYYFHSLEIALEVYEYAIDDRYNHHAEEAERYSKEWEQLKGGRNA